jgi:hypothetical protein
MGRGAESTILIRTLTSSAGRLRLRLLRKCAHGKAWATVRPAAATVARPHSWAGLPATKCRAPPCPLRMHWVTCDGALPRPQRQLAAGSSSCRFSFTPQAARGEPPRHTRVPGTPAGQDRTPTSHEHCFLHLTTSSGVGRRRRARKYRWNTHAKCACSRCARTFRHLCGCGVIRVRPTEVAVGRGSTVKHVAGH